MRCPHWYNEINLCVRVWSSQGVLSRTSTGFTYVLGSVCFVKFQVTPSPLHQSGLCNTQWWQWTHTFVLWWCRCSGSEVTSNSYCKSVFYERPHKKNLFLIRDFKNNEESLLYIELIYPRMLFMIRHFRWPLDNVSKDSKLVLSIMSKNFQYWFQVVLNASHSDSHDGDYYCILVSSIHLKCEFDWNAQDFPKDYGTGWHHMLWCHCIIFAWHWHFWSVSLLQTFSLNILYFNTVNCSVKPFSCPCFLFLLSDIQV